MISLVSSATKNDQEAIRRLIRAVNINPFGLKWQNFVVIKDENGRLLACGQLKPHKDGSIELASIAVVETHRKQGLAHTIIKALLASKEPSIWLMCEYDLAAYYKKFGFEEFTAVAQMPPYFKRIVRVSSFIQKTIRGKQLLAIMCLSTNALP